MKILSAILAGAVAAACTLSPSMRAAAQTPAAAAIPSAEQENLLLTARSRLYNLRTAGVKSFGCSVSMDWQAMFKAIANQELPADDARLKYLQAANLTFNQSLDSPAAAEVTWHLPAGADDNPAAKPLGVLLAGTKQMVAGFLESWTPTLNGTLIPAKPDSVTHEGAGYHLSSTTSGSSGELTLNHELAVTHITGAVGGTGGSFDTVFTPTAKGLVMTSMEGDSSPTADAQKIHISLKTTFAPVGEVQLPATLEVTVPNVAVFQMRFAGCTVTR